MRIMKIFVFVLFVLTLLVLAATVSVQAKENKFGVADVSKIIFVSPVRIADVLLPAGEYEVRHTMQGESHIMIFKQLGTAKPVQASVNCRLAPLEKKAERTETIYVLNASAERVLQRLVFRGDLAEHVF
jgi:hypothetical protein